MFSRPLDTIDNDFTCIPSIIESARYTKPGPHGLYTELKKVRYWVSYPQGQLGGHNYINNRVAEEWTACKLITQKITKIRKLIKTSKLGTSWMLFVISIKAE